MVFSTHAGKKLATEVQARAWRWLWALACLWVGCLSVLAAEPVQVSEQRVVRTEDSVQVFARLSLRLSQPVEEALLKGVPLFFVWQADVVRDRWYWRDKRLTTQYRTWRLAYQPLTRRWRLSLSHQAPGAAQQFSLHQNLASLEQALAAVGRLHRWSVLPAERAPITEEHRVELGFRLDPSLLPRPFQIGVGSSADWDIQWQQRLAVPARVAPDAQDGTDSTDNVPSADTGSN